MKIKVKGSGIAIIELEEGDGSASGELQAIAADLKQSITGLSGIVTELSNIVLNGLHEQVTNLTTSVQMLSTSVTVVNEKFQTITESFSSVNIINSYNQYVTMPCPPGEKGEGGEKKEESEAGSFFKIVKDIYDIEKGIKDLVEDVKRDWNLGKAIKGGNPEEISAAEDAIADAALKDAEETIVEGIGEFILGDIGEVIAGAFLASNPVGWAIMAGIAVAGAVGYEMYKHSQQEEKKQDDTKKQPDANNNVLQGGSEVQPLGTISNMTTDTYRQHSFSPEFGTGGPVYSTMKPGDLPMGTFAPGGLNSMQGGNALQGGGTNSPNTVNGNGQGAGNGYLGGQGMPITPMPSLCEQIRECMQGYNPQAMPMSPMYPGMGASASSMSVTYNYTFGSVAAFSGTSNMAASVATGGNFQAQFIEILTQAVQDSKVAADIH